MNRPMWIIAGPDLSGLDRDPGIWVILTLAVIFFFAGLYIVSKEFRLTMHHPPQKRDGRLYRIALGIVVTGLIFMAVCAAWFVLSIRDFAS